MLGRAIAEAIDALADRRDEWGADEDDYFLVLALLIERYEDEIYGEGSGATPRVIDQPTRATATFEVGFPGKVAGAGSRSPGGSPFPTRPKPGYSGRCPSMTRRLRANRVTGSSTHTGRLRC